MDHRAPAGQEEPSLSVIVPAFNESRRIGEPLQRIGSFLAGQDFRSEIVVVDDGSVDGTLAAVQSLAPSLPVPLTALRYPQNRGKGHALRVGFRAAAGRRLLFTDADLSTPIEEAARFLAALDGGSDVVIGSRKMRGAKVTVHQPWLRETLGRGFTALCRLLVANVSDVTCGFKAFRKEAGKDIFGRGRISGWAFDAEVLFLARRLGYRIEELPVAWENRDGTKVKLRRDVAGSLIGLARIRYCALSGAYMRESRIPQEMEMWLSDDGAGSPSTRDTRPGIA